MQKVLVDGYVVTAASTFSCRAGDELLIVGGVCIGLHHKSSAEGPRHAAPLLLVHKKPAPPQAGKKPPKKKSKKPALAERRKLAADLRVRVVELLRVKQEPLPALRIGDILDIPRNSIDRAALSLQLRGMVERGQLRRVKQSQASIPFYTAEKEG